MNYKKYSKNINFKEPSNVVLYGLGAIALLFILYWIIKILLIIILVFVVGYCLYLLFWRKGNGKRKKSK